MTIKIDEGQVAMPPVRRQYPLAGLEVGQSFFAECADARECAAAASAAMNHGRRNGRKYRTQKVLINGQAGVRVWRIE